MKDKQISSSEYEIMKIIWKNNGTAYYADILSALEASNLNWKKNTILTFLSRLVTKNILKVNKIGRINQYIALLTEEEYMVKQTEYFVGEVYEGDVKGLVSTLISKDLISSNEIDELKNFWKQRKKDK